MQHRTDDRWREPIMLGLGYIQGQRPELIEKILNRLIVPDENGHPKPVDRWYRDLIFAAEIGADRDWEYLSVQSVDVESIRTRLRSGLVELLADPQQPLPAAERIRAGFLLGKLGDPRYPVTVEQWRREVKRAAKGNSGGYFCRVEPGTYTIGSTDDDPNAQDDEKPQHTVTFNEPFLIGRYPITFEQWQHWTGVEWTEPYTGESNPQEPNLPLGGVGRDSAQDCCRWLSRHLAMTMKLPTEFEWEAAARGGTVAAIRGEMSGMLIALLP